MAITVEMERMVDQALKDQRDKDALRFSKILFWFSSVMALINLAQWLFFREYIQLPLASVGTVPAILCSAVFPYLARQKKVEVGIQLYLGGLLTSLFLDFPLVPNQSLALISAFYGIVVFSQQLLQTEKSKWLAYGSMAAFSLDLIILRFLLPHITAIRPMPDALTLRL